MMRTRQRQIVTIALLLIGILWAILARADFTDHRLLAIWGIILAISAVWPLGNRLAAVADRIDRWLGSRRGAAAICIAAMVALHLGVEAHRFRAELYLKFHDEPVHMIEAHMLAHGRLWMPPYPPSIRDFFDSFYLIVDRVYAGMYPPGTAIMMLPAIWLGLGHWMMPILAGTAASAFLYLMLEEMFAPVRAMVGVLLLVSLNLFMSMSFMVLSEAPFLLSELACVWAWMRWRRTRRAGWLLLLGISAGYGAITRPADMFCVASAVGIAILYELRRQPKTFLHAVAFIFAGACPFLAIQVIQNIGVSGSWDQTPVRYYTDHNYPAPILSFAHVNAADVPPTNCLPKKIAMKQWILPDYEEHWRLSLWQIWYPQRFQEVIHQTLASSLLVIFLPLSVLSLGEIRRAAIVGAMLLFFILYTADAVFLDHYVLAIAPAMICLILMGWQSLERSLPRARPMIFTFMSLAIGAAAIRALPEFNSASTPLGTSSDENRAVDRILATLPRSPALVLFRFDPKINTYHAEPVYNADVAWPDDAAIVRARDLGENENLRLYRYYVQLRQNRDVYLYDRAAGVMGQNPLTRLGTVRQLAGN
jgi:hypothetical protein